MCRRVYAAIGDLEILQRASIAQPIGDELAEKRRLEQPVEDHAWQSHAFGIGLVIVDLVEIALRTRVLDELPRGWVLDELRKVLTRFDVHRRIIVPRSFATTTPSWLT